ncbi:hypothetical protein P168DRAFT_291389 [Aspergillus campestris IBT 28561]|uniref:Uncharacterized protein n=1 Tax=Aspergillus campestris (strain IBT 28561) TaxID=1392248 RepID=A0A2I1D046_ASPC2|nr:uncharacterized protein P168DRAFT_291389 [Aspergillus campestris IBT 28561]PKY03257.1 hypothetical protein P168DRAFT_291389 [Aspergillus campestris IBT 28561]
MEELSACGIGVYLLGTFSALVYYYHPSIVTESPRSNLMPTWLCYLTQIFVF